MSRTLQLQFSSDSAGMGVLSFSRSAGSFLGQNLFQLRKNSLSYADETGAYFGQKRGSLSGKVKAQPCQMDGGINGTV